MLHTRLKHTSHRQPLLRPSYLPSPGLGAQFTHTGKPLAPRAGREPTSASPQNPKGNYLQLEPLVSAGTSQIG